MSENDCPRPEVLVQPPAQQIDSMSDELRICLWDALCNFLNGFDVATNSWRGLTYTQKIAKYFCLRLWVDFFNQPKSQFSGDGLDNSFKALFKCLKCYQVYGLIGFILDECHKFPKGLVFKQYVLPPAISFYEACENCLTKHNSSHRICGRKVVPITSEQELAEIDSAINSAHPPPGDHIDRALSLFTNRTTPDYPNSIKESISAVESLAKIVTGKEKATLGELTRELGELHPAFQQALGKLYGYTSDAQGIRHGAFDDSAQIRQEDARFMLVICSAFVNYIEAKRRD